MIPTRAQHVIDKALLPVPAGWNVILGGYKYSRTFPNRHDIHWVPDWYGNLQPDDLTHEFGHAGDFEWFTPEIRKALIVNFSMGLPKHMTKRSWEWDRDPFEISDKPDPWCEVWANRFSIMCKTPHKYPKLRGWYLHYLKTIDAKTAQFT